MLPAKTFDPRTGQIDESFEQSLARSVAHAAGAPWQLVDFDNLTPVHAPSIKTATLVLLPPKLPNTYCTV